MAARPCAEQFPYEMVGNETMIRQERVSGKLSLTSGDDSLQLDLAPRRLRVMGLNLDMGSWIFTYGCGVAIRAKTSDCLLLGEFRPEYK